MKRITNYRPPVEESDSEIVWTSRNDVETNKMPYDQIADEYATEDVLIDKIDNPQEEEEFSTDAIDDMVQHEDYWWVERYIEKFPQAKDYVQVNYPQFLEKKWKN
jgi:hypothetical protein